MIYSSYFFEPALFEQQPQSDPAMAMIGAHLLIVGHQSLSICSAVNQRKSIGGLLVYFGPCSSIDRLKSMYPSELTRQQTGDNAT